GGFLHGGGLLLGAARQVFRRSAELAGAGIDGARILARIAHRLAKAGGGGVEVGAQALEVAVEGFFDAAGHVAARKPAERVGKAGDGFLHAAAVARALGLARLPLAFGAAAVVLVPAVEVLALGGVIADGRKAGRQRADLVAPVGMRNGSIRIARGKVP